MWGLFLFLIYINDLPNGIKLICKISADGTLFFFSKFKQKNSQGVGLRGGVYTSISLTGMLV